MPHRFPIRSLALLLAWALLLFTAGAGAQALPQGVTRVSATEGITEYRLANGLTVLLFPDAAKPTALVNITYRVGSRHENYGETGMAHLLEHLVFKGTPRHRNIPQEFNRRGMRINATTGLDRTNYFELFQASDDNLRWALNMEADRMVNSFISAKDLASEMTVVRNEFENGENSPFGVMYKRMQSVVFDWHNYGNATIGNRSDIENVRIENLQRFYRTYYQPDNAVLLVAGKFDVAQTLRWVAQAFGPIPKPRRTLPTFWTVEPTQDGERSFVVRRQGDVQIVELVYRIPGELHPDRDALGLAASVLADTPNGRLYQQLVAGGLAVEVFQGGLSGLDPGFLMLGAVLKKDAPVEPVRQALIEAAENFHRQPPSAQEMERVRREDANQWDQMMSAPESVGMALSESVALGDWRLLFQMRDRALRISAEQAAAAAGRYFRRDNRTVGLFLPQDAPQRAEIPTAPDSADVLRDFQPRAAAPASEGFDPSTANIDARTQRSRAGGVQLALLPKKTRGETVSVALTLRLGNADALRGKQTIANLTQAMLLRGTRQYSRQQLADAFSRLKIRGDLTQFDTTREHLADALRLVAHVLREPAFAPDEFEQLRTLIVADTEAARHEPRALAQQALQQHFNRYPQGDWRAPLTLDETIAQVQAASLDEVKAFHQAFYGASQAELGIVGDFDVEQVRQVVEQTFAAWPSATPYARVSDQYFEVEPLRQVLDTPDKEGGVYLARLNLDLRDDDPDFAALLVANQLFGNSGMDSRLMQRIRQKEGWSYGGGSSLGASAQDRVGAFTISAIAAPQNLGRVEAAVREELLRSLEQGFSAQEVARAQSGMLQHSLQARAQDAVLAREWANYLAIGRTFAWDQGLEARIRALTPAQVDAAWRRAIDPARLSVVLAGDRSKMELPGTPRPAP